MVISHFAGLQFCSKSESLSDRVRKKNNSEDIRHKKTQPDIEEFKSSLKVMYSGKSEKL